MPSNPNKNTSKTSVAEYFLQTLAADFPLGVVAWDQDNIIRYINPVGEKIFNYNAEDIIGQNMLGHLLNNEVDTYNEFFLGNLSTMTTDQPHQYHGTTTEGDSLVTLWRPLQYTETGDTDLKIALVEDQTTQVNLLDKAQFSIQSYHELSGHLSDFIYTHDLQGNFISVNKNGAALLGYSAAEFQQLNIKDIVVPEQLVEIQNQLKLKIKNPSTKTTYEVQTITKDNKLKWLSVSTRVLENDGQMIGIQGIARDITHQKEYEINLQQSEQKFRGIFETIDDIFFHTDINSKFDLLSPSCYTHLGFKPEELMGFSITDLYAAPETRQVILNELMTNGYINDKEINLLHKNKTVVPFSVSSRIVHNDQGIASGIEGVARNITQRKEHEQILKTNEQRFRRIFDSIQDVYFRTEDSIVKFVSPSCKTLLGYAPEEIIGRPSNDFFYESNTREIMIEHFVESNYCLTDYELTYKHKNGTPVTCSLNMNGITNDKGELVAHEGTLRDITARKQADQALLASEQRFRRIFESFQDTYYEADMEGILTVLSPSVKAHYGYEPEELIGKPASYVYADPAQREGLLEALRKSGYVNDYEIILISKQGEIKPTSCSTRINFDDAGNPVSIQGVLRDITQRKKDDAALRDSEESFRSIFNSIPDGFLEINCFDTIVNASPSVQQFGYPAQSLIGSNIMELFEFRNEWHSLRKLINDQGEVKGMELTLTTTNKINLPVSVTAYKIRAQSSTSGNTICIIRDISTRKQYEQELEMARDQALEASRAKSSFLANMSHELRTPLNAIIGYSEMLHDDALDDGKDEVANDLQKINDSGTHLLSLISDILDLSKIEAGKIEIIKEEINLKDMLNEIMITISPIAQQNNNTLNCNNQLDDNIIIADRIRLKQAIYNLLSNACKFTNDGTVSLEVKKVEADGIAWIDFRISDTGIGITDEQMGKLFNEFSQADSTTTREYGGSGLGLVISQRFCQLMGGEIKAHSKFGEGSEFIIRLPARA